MLKNYTQITDDSKLSITVNMKGKETTTEYNGKDALKCVEKEDIDLAILDVMLPDIDGFDICQKIRENHHFPVIMLTARDENIDKITGLR